VTNVRAMVLSRLSPLFLFNDGASLVSGALRFAYCQLCL